MKTAHAGMGITNGEYNAFAAIMVKVMKEHKMAAADLAEMGRIVESLRKDIVEDKPKPAPPSAPSRTLWDRLGGEEAVKLVVHDFVAAAGKNPKVNATRNGKFKLDDKGVANQEKLLVDLVSANSGGPRKYTGKDMKTAHAGMQITDAEFDAAVADLVGVLKKHKVPQKESDELVKIIAGTRKDVVEKK